MANIFNEGKVVPTADVNVQRSTFKDVHSYKTTFTSGRLIPVYCREILPGDSIKINPAFLCRMLTPVVPVMDNAYLDLRFFFVPSRLCVNAQGTDNKLFQKFLGENTTSAWANDVTDLPNSCTLPFLPLYGNTDTSGTLWDYFGLPFLKNTSSEVRQFHFGSRLNIMPFNAYQTIWNEWYRSENLQNPSYLQLDQLVRSEPFPVCKLHDVFTDALPSPQKGDDVMLNFLEGLAPVVGTDTLHNVGTASSGLAAVYHMEAGDNSMHGAMALGRSNQVGVDTGYVSDNSNFAMIEKSNLVADVGAVGVTAGSVNQLRTAFSLQRQREKDARGGTRYVEKLSMTYGVEAPDSLLQRPEYLGGESVPINLDTVLQTSATAGNSALGDTGAFSLTTSDGSDCEINKSFVEFGYLLGLVCVRTEQSYFQGINKMWRHTTRDSFYSPTFANIGEQPIKTSELYFTPDDPDTDIFGYQEAWYEYRYTPNQITGKLNPLAGDKTLATWTYANPFQGKPTLGDNFIRQDSRNVGDTLVDTQTTTQFIADFCFNDLISRPMPLYSVPGLIDHF